jgi:hypothetical protein
MRPFNAELVIRRGHQKDLKVRGICCAIAGFEDRRHDVRRDVGNF